MTKVKTDTYTAIIPIIEIAESLEAKEYVFSSLRKIANENFVLVFDYSPEYQYGVTRELLLKYKGHTNDHYPLFALKLECKLPRSIPGFKNREFYTNNQFYPSKHLENFLFNVFYFLVLTQIAFPMTVYSYNIELFCNGGFYPHYKLQFHNVIPEGILYDETGFYKWPALIQIDLEKVILWNSVNHFCFWRISSNSTERAINAFTHLFPDDFPNYTQILLWSLVGLEALYCVGEGKAEQINSKSQALFGKMESFKQKLKMMYNFRSMLIHGTLNFTALHFNHELEPMAYHKDLIKYSALSSILLTRTLQEMVAQNRFSLDFTYSLK